MANAYETALDLFVALISFLLNEFSDMFKVF